MANPQTTGMMTPDQVQQQLAARNTLNQRLTEDKYSYEVGADVSTVPPEVQAKRQSMSIVLINISFILILLTGIVGSFFEGFNMDKFVSFLQVFAYVWAPLLIAVAGGKSFKNWTEKKYAPSGSTPVDTSVPPQ